MDGVSTLGVFCGLKTVEQLRQWARHLLGLRLPVRGVCPGHCSPLEYLRRSYFEPASDLVVWAPRGGGKTRLGAVATLLDLAHKPGCTVRILGGSLEQSLKMWEHLYPDLLRLLEPQMVGQGTARRIELKNGSCAAVLTQSQRAVRGLRVQKLRCDEVELFDAEIWEAAQLVTRSKSEEGRVYAGAVEALSTLHTPFGLMQRIVEQAEASGTPVVKWCLMEVLERCEAERECKGCPLWEECKGVAKTVCEGFVPVSDAIAMKKRVSTECWEAEMLCRRPTIRQSVFPQFDPAVHVREQVAAERGGEGELWLAIDFGYSNPFVCLWVRTWADGTTHVIDEYVQEQRQVHEHIAHIGQRRHGRVFRVACDPSGASRDEQTARSNVQLLREAGYNVRHRPSRILEGVEMVRTALKPASGAATLFVHPRCRKLIAAMQCYRYGEGGSELPLKDGVHDHLIDALRYYFVNRAGGAKVKVTVY